MPNKKPNCYKCKYRGTIPGDAHSRCCYPGVDSGLLSFFAPANDVIAVKLNIKADEHGVKSGWCFWPSNFDPIWLLNCDGFTPREV